MSLKELLAMLRIPSASNPLTPPWNMIQPLTIPPAQLAVSTDLTAEVRRIQQEIADLQGDPIRARAGHRLQRLQARLAELTGDGGVTPPPSAAPTFSPRIDTPRVGVDALKIMLPS